MDLFIVSILSFLLSFILTIVLNALLTKRIAFLLLSGRANSKSKKIFFYKNVGSILGFVGVMVSSTLLLFLGFIPLDIFFNVLLYPIFIFFIANELLNMNINKVLLIAFRLLCAFLFVYIFNFTFLEISFVTKFVSAGVLVFLCIQVISFLNNFDRILIISALGFSFFGIIIGVYLDNTLLTCCNISVFGSLLALSYSNFTSKLMIKLGFVGEMFIGFFISGLLFYIFSNNIQELVYSRFLPLIFLIFLYPVLDILQLFCVKLINKIFYKNLSELQIHSLISTRKTNHTNSALIIIFSVSQVFVLVFIVLSYGFSY